MAATLDARLRLDSSQFSGGLSRAMRESNAFVGKMSAQFGTLKNVLMGGAVGGLGISGIMTGIDKAAEFEKFERMLALVSGGAAAAKVEMAELRKEAIRPGLDLESAVEGTVRLRTLGYTSQETRKHLIALSNKVAAFGGGGNEMKGIVNALSQMASKGKVSAEEIEQLAERMPGIRQDMKAAFGTSNTEEIQKMGVSAKEFIDTILQNWSEAPPVVSGITEEIKNLRSTLDSFKAYSGQIFAPMIGGLTTVLQGFGDLHQMVTRDLDSALAGLFGGWFGGFTKAREAEQFAGEMERRKADADAANKNKPVFGSTPEQMEKHAQAVREFQARRESIAAVQRDSVDTEEEELVLIDEQIAAMTDLQHTIDTVNEAYKNHQDVNKDTLEKYKDGNKLLQDRAAIIDRINAKEANAIRAEVAEEMMTPRERKEAMRKDYDEKRAQKKVLRRRENEALEKEMAEAQANNLDNIKKGKFANKDEARQRIRKEQAERLKDVFKNSEQYLKSIEQILGKLAVA